MKDEYKLFFAERVNFGQDLNLYLKIASNGRHFIAKPIEVEEYPEGQRQDPTISINYQEAQVLLDELLLAGIRPSDGSLSTGEKKALESHLEDMRKIVSKKLGVNL